MTIDPFVFGILCTVGCEAIIILAFIIILIIRGNKK